MNRLTDHLLARDLQLFKFVQAKVRCQLLNLVMAYITYLGGAVFTILSPLLLIILGRGELIKVGYEILTSLTVSHFVVHIIKRKINRPRPYKILEEIEIYIVPFEDYSFPSGHTTASFSMAVTLSFYFTGCLVLLISLASLVGMSRVYLGVHYPSDVMIGAMIGTLFSTLLHLGIM
ncbi:MAG: phosphatase PAP2 family protein [Bacillota bacterium]